MAMICSCRRVSIAIYIKALKLIYVNTKSIFQLEYIDELTLGKSLLDRSVYKTNITN